jgi:Phage integrase, N-terminal SAM-like domain
MPARSEVPRTRRQRSSGALAVARVRRRRSRRPASTGVQNFVGGERQAAKALAALVIQVEAGTFDRSKATVGELLDAWLEHIEGLGRRPPTLAGYRTNIDYAIRPVLGDIKITKLKADDLARYRKWTELGLKQAILA